MPFFSASTGGFYLPEIHGDAIPADAVAITAEHHAALLDAQAAGQVIQPGEGGVPVAVAPPPPSAAALAAAARARRDAALAASDWTQMPDSPLAAAAQAAWATHRQALRDWPQQPGWPDLPLPAPPGA